MSGKPSSREAILDAAEAVVLSAGAAHLTLEAVAESAGVSKGGLLYHFPSKDALVEGMIARCVERFEGDRRTAERRTPATASRGLRAYVETSLDHRSHPRQVNAALLAAGANNPKLLDPLRKFNSRWFGELAGRKAGFARAVAVVLATHGLWLLETLQISPLTAGQRREVVEELLALSEDAS
jgi:AcrR family transcriptional regulator